MWPKIFSGRFLFFILRFSPLPHYARQLLIWIKPSSEKKKKNYVFLFVDGILRISRQRLLPVTGAYREHWLMAVLVESRAS